MTNDNVIPLVLTRELALKKIRHLAERGMFAIEPHARDAMNDPDRDVPMRLVEETLLSGSINQGPTRDEAGEWRCRLKKRHAGRLVHVVVALSGHDFMYVVTVY